VNHHHESKLRRQRADHLARKGMRAMRSLGFLTAFVGLVMTFIGFPVPSRPQFDSVLMPVGIALLAAGALVAVVADYLIDTDS
jgi:hypothetical protein